MESCFYNEDGTAESEKPGENCGKLLLFCGASAVVPVERRRNPRSLMVDDVSPLGLLAA